MPITRAATISDVDTTDDELNNDGDCSLREAIQAANTDAQVDQCTAGTGDDTIILPAGTYTLTISPDGTPDDNYDGDLDIFDTDGLTITGVGPDSTIINANSIDRVFDIRPGAGTVVISGVTIMDGNITGDGGGIYNDDADLTLINTVVNSDTASSNGGGVYVGFGSAKLEGGQIVSNTAIQGGGGVYIYRGSATLSGGQVVSNTAARDGGGIYNQDGALVLVNTTVSGNGASASGGGLYNDSGGTSVLTYTTVASNTATSGGGGIHRAGGTVLLQNTIVAHNGTANCNGGVTSNGHNLEYGDTCNLTATTDITDTDPLLGPLTYDRGTLVHPLLAGSPAIDAGVCISGITTDQRGMSRVAPCDIGAYERVWQKVYLPLVLRNY
jgi:CSLREA domain-containing protein